MLNTLCIWRWKAITAEWIWACNQQYFWDIFTFIFVNVFFLYYYLSTVEFLILIINESSRLKSFRFWIQIITNTIDFEYNLRKLGLYWNKKGETFQNLDSQLKSSILNALNLNVCMFTSSGYPTCWLTQCAVVPRSWATLATDLFCLLPSCRTSTPYNTQCTAKLLEIFKITTQC